jgi:nuclear RNA export factor
MICLTVTGLFKERHSDPKLEFTRIFQKTLVIVPNNGGFCIRNEMLHINNASPIQARNAFKTPAIVPTPQVIPQQQQQPNTSTQQLDDATKMRMIEAISQQTNMNLEWSRKCLEETTWDYNRAVFVFQELFKKNQIPQEAFTK